MVPSALSIIVCHKGATKKEKTKRVARHQRLLVLWSLGCSPASNVSDGRGSVGVERFGGLQAPGLALPALGFAPTDGFPIRRQDQPRARVGYFYAITARFIDVQEKGLLDGVLVRPGFDIHAVFQENVGGAQHVLTAIDGVGNVMEAALGASMIARVSKS